MVRRRGARRRCRCFGLFGFFGSNVLGSFSEFGLFDGDGDGDSGGGKEATKATPPLLPLLSSRQPPTRPWPTAPLCPAKMPQPSPGATAGRCSEPAQRRRPRC